VISGMGELHLDIIVDRMRREYKVDANVGSRRCLRETITREVKSEGKYIRQSGGPRAVRPCLAAHPADAAGRRFSS